MAKHRLISNFFSKTFPLLKQESMFPELSDWEHHKASTGPGGHSRYLHCACVYGEHTQPSRPSRRQERSWHQLSCQSLRESPPSPTCLWWWRRFPSPTPRLAELQAGCPHVQGGSLVTLWWTKLKRSALDQSFLPQTSAGQAEKKCFCNEVYWKKCYFWLCPRNGIYMF